MLNPKCSFGVVIRPWADNGATATTSRKSDARCVSRSTPGKRVERVERDSNMSSNLWDDGTVTRYVCVLVYAGGAISDGGRRKSDNCEAIGSEMIRLIPSGLVHPPAAIRRPPSAILRSGFGLSPAPSFI